MKLLLRISLSYQGSTAIKNQSSFCLSLKYTVAKFSICYLETILVVAEYSCNFLKMVSRGFRCKVSKLGEYSLSRKLFN